MKKFIPLLLLTGLFTFMYGKEDEDFNNGVQYKNPALTDGFRISGALSGLSGSFHSDLEPRLRQDSIFYSNQFNLDWYGHKKSRHLKWELCLHSSRQGVLKEVSA